MLAKIKEYRVSQKGQRGLTLTMPRVWVDDLEIKKGDIVLILRDPKSDDLVIRKKVQ